MASGNPNYYSNPAFCQQSEFYPRNRIGSPERRQPPVGAHKPILQEVPPKIGPKPRIIQRNNSVKIKIGPSNDNESEEVIIDDPRNYQDNQKYLDITNGNTSSQYEEYDHSNRTSKPNKGRYQVIQVSEDTEETRKHRYEYIPMQEHGYPSSPRKLQQNIPQHTQEDVEIVKGKVHRYAVIPTEEEDIKNRYALVPVSEIKPNSRYAVIPQERNRYDYIPEPQDHKKYVTSPQISRKNSDAVIPQERNNRYDYIPEPSEDHMKYITSPQISRRNSDIATQKLHELLSTPKKPQTKTPSKIQTPQSTPRISSPGDPFVTPQKSPPKVLSPRTHPRAQQKLNYALSTRHQNDNKRHTAIISPICSSPVQSVYSETTFSNKTESWMNLSLQKPQATLAVAAVMMVLCGGLTAGLCFYMVSVVGRMYYLDFGTISGFACLLLGLLGFRSRNCYWLPNRNYISGYIVLSAFSLLTCAGLVVLLALQPKPGSPLADVTSGAVCGISGLSLILASTGVVASYCCKVPPPDNRVQHCAPGFTV